MIILSDPYLWQSHVMRLLKIDFLRVRTICFGETRGRSLLYLVRILLESIFHWASFVVYYLFNRKVHRYCTTRVHVDIGVAWWFVWNSPWFRAGGAKRITWKLPRAIGRRIGSCKRFRGKQLCLCSATMGSKTGSIEQTCQNIFFLSCSSLFLQGLGGSPGHPKTTR